MVILKDSSIAEYSDYPDHMEPIGKFTYLRTYSRYDEDKGRRETWKETLHRATNYNVGLAVKHLEELDLPVDMEKMKTEAHMLFDNQFQLKQALSGRTLWIGGAKNGVAGKFPLANFNCSFTNIEVWEDLAELFYLLLVGTGVGFKVTPKMARNLPPLRDDIEVVMDEYNALPKGLRTDDTKFGEGLYLVYNKETMRYQEVNDPEAVTIYVGDSKEGWVDSVRKFFIIMSSKTYGHIKRIHINYDSVRPAGEPLKTFGGTSSGPLPLVSMYQTFDKVIKGTLDASIEPWERTKDGRVRIRPIGIADMANAVGYNVVVGGVRRSSEIYLFSGDPGEVDYESLFMKFGVNGFYGEDAFAFLDQVEAEANKMDIPLPKNFEAFKVRHYDVAYKETSEDGSLVPTKATFTSLEGAKLFAKSKGITDFKPYPYNPGNTHLGHRRMSNNSMAFHTPQKPEKALLDFIFVLMRGEGEPAFINLYEATRRRLKAVGITKPKIIVEHAYKIGLNPCAEILLYSKGVCNLTTVNVRAFVIDDEEQGRYLDYNGLIEAQRLSVRAGLRMTLAKLELPKWDKVQKRDRLLGASLTGWKDMASLLELEPKDEEFLLKRLSEAARDEAARYAKELRIPIPTLATTVKPEGTLSICFGAVSSGLHVSHSPFYSRKIRLNALDPLAKTVLASEGWRVHAEVDTLGFTREEDLAKPSVVEQARTIVIDFPVASGATKTKAETGVDEQFDTYFMFQRAYTDHNASITVHLRAHEWERACARIYDGWEDFVGISFLSFDENTYTLAPYTTIDEATYTEIHDAMAPLDDALLRLFDAPPSDDSSIDGIEACEGGICPIR